MKMKRPARKLEKRNGTGPPSHGKKMGPGKGKRDGSGLRKVK